MGRLGGPPADRGAKLRRIQPLLAGALVCLSVLPPAVAAPRSDQSPPPVRRDALTRALAGGRLTPAEYALERARSAFARAEVEARFGDVAPVSRTGLTLVLRDLALRQSQLSGSQRRAGRRLLARPTDRNDQFGDSYRR